MSFVLTPEEGRGLCPHDGHAGVLASSGPQFPHMYNEGVEWGACGSACSPFTGLPMICSLSQSLASEHQVSDSRVPPPRPPLSCSPPRPRPNPTRRPSPCIHLCLLCLSFSFSLTLSLRVCTHPCVHSFLQQPSSFCGTRSRAPQSPLSGASVRDRRGVCTRQEVTAELGE